MSFTNRTSSSLSSSDVEMRRRATDLSSRTRLSAHFAEIEHAFPKLRVPGPIPTSVSGALSFLGSRNPMPVPITKRDTVWVFDNTAYRSRKGGGWEAEFVTAAFEQEPKTSIADFVATVAEKIGLADDDDVSRDVIADRIEPFLLEILPGRRVHATHNPGKRGERQLRLGPTGRNGISSDIRYLSHHAEDGDKLLTVADVPKGANGLLEGKTTYAGPEGWAVISDIDDTIKITQTSDPIGILRTTFLETPRPTAGMPEFYAFLQSLIARDDPPWFYLSASPYNLYPFLRFFTRKHYPHGTIILRDSSWQTLPGLLSNLTVGTHEYKVDRMTKVHSWLPRRKMILIGDSTQSDPEAYGEIYRKFPGWVRLILIRKVTDIASIGIAAKNEPERFEKAFQGVPRCRWAVFEDPTDVYALVQDLVRPDNPDDERLPTTVEEERKKDKRRSHPVGHSTSQGGKGGSRRHRRYVSEDVAVYRNRSRSSSRRRPYR